MNLLARQTDSHGLAIFAGAAHMAAEIGSHDTCMHNKTFNHVACRTDGSPLTIHTTSRLCHYITTCRRGFRVTVLLFGWVEESSVSPPPPPQKKNLRFSVAIAIQLTMTNMVTDRPTGAQRCLPPPPTPSSRRPCRRRGHRQCACNRLEVWL
jgi:hypothetical protein